MADEIRSILLAIEVESNKSKKDVDTLEKSIEKLNKTMNRTEAQEKELAEQTDKLNKKRKESNSATAGLTKTLGKYAKALGGAAAAAGALALIGKGLVSSLKENKVAMDVLAQESAALDGAMEVLSAAVSGTIVDFLGLEDAMDEAGGRMTLTEQALGFLSAGMVALGHTGLANLGIQMQSAAEEARKLEAITQGLRDTQAKHNLDIGILKLSYEELVAQTRELDQTADDNIVTLRRASRVFEEQSQLVLGRVKTEVALAKAQVAAAATTQGKQRADDNLNAAELRLAETERMLSAQRRELLNRQKEAENASRAVTKAYEAQVKATMDLAAIETTTTLDISKNTKARTDAIGAQFAATKKQNDAAAATGEKRKTAILSNDEEIRQSKIAGLDTALSISSSLKGLNIENAALNKGIAISETIINTARGIMATIGQTGFFGTPLALIVGAMGAAQLAIISNQEFASGGMLKGRSHSKGGVNINAEGGEAVLNKRSMANPVLRSMASDINVAGGGKKFAMGGMVGSITPTLDNTFTTLGNQFENAIKKAPPILVLEDLSITQNRVAVTENRASF